MNRLILRQYVLGFLLGFQILGLVLMAFMRVDKDVLFAVAAVLSPVMLLMAKGVIDSNESDVVEDE